MAVAADARAAPAPPAARCPCAGCCASTSAPQTIANGNARPIGRNEKDRIAASRAERPVNTAADRWSLTQDGFRSFGPFESFESFGAFESFQPFDSPIYKRYRTKNDPNVSNDPNDPIELRQGRVIAGRGQILSTRDARRHAFRRVVVAAADAGRVTLRPAVLAAADARLEAVG